MSILTFDDMTVGDTREFGSYKVTREEILEFAGKYDPQRFHTDEEAARKTHFGGLIASGWHTCSICMRILCDNYFINSTGIGSPGVDEIRWKRPVRPGDVLSVRVGITKVARSRSKPDRGTIWNDIQVINQNGETVMTMTSITMMLTRAGFASTEGSPTG